jgi:hypothetical protein
VSGGFPVTAWTPDELATIDRTDEIRIASRRTDGSLRPFITIWVVRLGDDVFVRSAHGPENDWFRRAVASGEGRIRFAGAEHDVAFEASGPHLDDALHAAYHAKYDRYGRAPVASVVSADAARSTLRLVPH